MVRMFALAFPRKRILMSIHSCCRWQLLIIVLWILNLLSLDSLGASKNDNGWQRQLLNVQEKTALSYDCTENECVSPLAKIVKVKSSGGKPDLPMPVKTQASITKERPTAALKTAQRRMTLSSLSPLEDGNCVFNSQPAKAPENSPPAVTDLLQVEPICECRSGRKAVQIDKRPIYRFLNIEMEVKHGEDRKITAKPPVSEEVAALSIKSKEAGKNKIFLLENINRLEHIKKGEAALTSFLKDSENAALVLMEIFKNNPACPNCNYYRVLLKFADALRKYNFYEHAAKWYKEIYSQLFTCLNKKQKDDFKRQFDMFVDPLITESFHKELVNIRVLNITETHQLLLHIFQSLELFNLLDLDRQAEMMAIACQVVVSRNENPDAVRIFKYCSYDDLVKNSKFFFKDNNPAWWVARFLWIAVSTHREYLDAQDIVPMIEKAEKDVWTLSLEQWSRSFVLPQSYYRMRVECLPVYFKIRKPDHEKILWQLLNEIKYEYPKICKSEKRVKVMISSVLLSLGNFMIHHEKTDQVLTIISELKGLGLELEGNIPGQVSMLEADTDMISYKKCRETVAKQSVQENITQLWRLEKRLRGHIKKMHELKEEHDKPSYIFCLGRIHYELGEMEKAEKAFSQYYGDAVLCYRLRGMTLMNLGRYQEASKLFQSLEGKNTPALNNIYLEHAVNLLQWIQSDEQTPDDIVDKALDKYMKAIEAGADDWSSGWSGVGHIFDILNKKEGQTFLSRRSKLLSPLNQCTGWDEASAIAFTIANSDQPEQTRRFIVSAGPKYYRKLLRK